MGLIFIISLLILGWAEMSTFIYIGNEVGGLFALLGVFATAIIGISLLKNQGLSVLNRVRSDIARGLAPVESIADSISLFIGGILMLIPGYLSDAIGLLLFIPGLRTIAGAYLLQWVARSRRFTGFINLSGGPFPREDGSHSSVNNKHDRFGVNQQQRQRDSSDDIIEGEYEERAGSESQLYQKKEGRSRRS